MNSSTPIRLAIAARHSRNRAFAATPPPTPSRVMPVRRGPGGSWPTSTSTTASWKLAARSRDSVAADRRRARARSGREAAYRTAVFSPEKLKISRSSCKKERGKA